MTYLTTAFSQVSAAKAAFFKAVDKHGWPKVGAAIALLVLLIVGGTRYAFSGGGEQRPEERVREVEVRSVADLSSESAPLSIVGVVSAVSQADVRAESSGQVIGVYKSLGDYVSAGTIVAELENASQRAAVLQAQGSVDAAQAAVEKIQGGTRLEQLAILQTAQDAAKSGAVNALLSAYAANDSAVQGTLDAMFANADTATPTFTVTTSNSQVVLNAQSQRVAVTPYLSREKTRSSSLSVSDDLATELSKTEKETRAVRDLLDSAITALNYAVPSQTLSQTGIDTLAVSANTARGTVTAALSSIATARQTLETANKNLEQGKTGAQTQDVAAAQAVLKQAQGGLAAARANLEKTIIRSPISGTINSFSLKRGDYVSMTSPVLAVANNGTLEVTSYVTQQDVKEIAIGDKVSLENGNAGAVTRIAPALDPITKKIEVRVGVSRTVGIVNGQSIIVNFKRKTPTVKQTNATLSIPIAALKVGADDATIFTVSTSSTLVAHDVQVGTLLGDRVEIREGVTPDMQIVVDARGLREGQTVTVK